MQVNGLVIAVVVLALVLVFEVFSKVVSDDEDACREYCVAKGLQPDYEPPKVPVRYDSRSWDGPRVSRPSKCSCK